MPASVPEKLNHLCRSLGVSDWGFFPWGEDAPGGLGGGIALVVRLSDGVVEEIDGAPTHSYFHHYRTVNTFLDQAMLRVGLALQEEGWRYLPVPASQSVPTQEDPRGFHGRWSHKKAAILAGLGWMGTSGLFLHKEWGPRVRLGTVFTDCPLCQETPKLLPFQGCRSCKACLRACPAGAIAGKLWEPGQEEFQLVDPAKCSEHMKRAYQKIGRGAVCGVCMRVCPAGRR